MKKKHLMQCCLCSLCSDQGQLVTSQVASTSGADQSKSWQWQQSTAQSDQDGRLVLYQVPVSAGGDGANCNGPTAAVAYYSIDKNGQLVKHDASGQVVAAKTADDSSRESQLELELVHLQSALAEKKTEVQSLKRELAEAYNIIEQYKRQAAGDAVAADAGNGTSAAGS